MFHPLILVFLLQVILKPALSCEADCETGITTAFIGNYSKPIQRVFLQIVSLFLSSVKTPAVAYRCSTDKATEIFEQFSIDQEDLQRLLEPINTTFYITAHDFYKHAIFPSHFHGKCQNPTTGINPPGCPNPSCPVICGTPGSLVYHYHDLETIVHNATKANYEQTINPSSAAFSETLHRVLRAMDSNENLEPPLRFPLARNHRAYRMQDQRSVNQTLSSILHGFSKLLDNQCGSSQKESESNLPSCDWRRNMIPYILTFP